ncbi:hypothetical protein BG28_05635 [Nesterenkonia sp. AN1]|uniref:AAA family ATPase n=1 Tax=Nesterenkonia sp. AN1 TaxID=652017 RepID=UPI000451999B|nr:AAA family ATPase [Nesterenkonia sp. AN1]EXF24570.1 hypothetical protein BG28_05635 [Nesterenkonia sp. AN1]
MKLHQLTLHAFGPFPGTEIIDFDRLGADGLFLLRGRTGAGKTSILDAVTFALYGDVPGQRDKTQLKSTHAPAESEPHVQLEFTQGGRRCRVWRSPHHGRPQKRDPSRQREVGQRVVVEFLQDGAWQPYTSGIQAANDEMQRMLGLDLHQFTKVILLPQGAFAHFLHASSKDKQDLLERLFDTDRFTLVEKHLRELAREAEQQLQASDTRIAMHRENLIQAAVAMLPAPADAEPGGPAPEALATGGPAPEAPETGDPAPEAPETGDPAPDALAMDGTAPEVAPPSTPEAPVAVPEQPGLREAELAELSPAELSPRVARAIETRHAQLQRSAAAADAAAQQASTALEELRAREETLSRFADHAERRAAHEAQREHISMLRAQLDRHESAAQIQTWFDAAEEAAQEHRTAGATASTTTQEAESSLGGFAALQPEEVTPRALFAEDQEPAAAVVLAAIEELIALRARLSGADAEKLETRLTQLREAQTQTLQQQEQAEAEAEALSGEQERLRAAHQALQTALEDPEELEAARDVARAHADLLAIRAQTQRTRDALQDRCASWRERQAERERAHDQVQDQHRARLQSYLRSIALQLAGELEDGAPCLVCGSTEHPDPAGDQDPSITREEVEHTQLQLQNARDELREAQIELRSLNAQRDAVLVELADSAEIPIERTEEELAQAREALTLAEQRRSEQRKLRERLDASVAERRRGDARHTEAQHQAQQAQATLKHQRTQIAELEAALAGLRGRYDSLRLRREALERVLEELRTSQRQIEAADVLRSHRDRAQRSAAAELEASVFTDRAHLQGAQLAQEVRDSQHQSLQRWDELQRQLDYESEQEVIRAGRRRRDEGQTRPEAAELDTAAEDSLAAAQAAADAAAAVLRFDTQREAVEDMSAKLLGALRHRDAALGEQRMRSELAATINGAGPENSLKMTLTTYVLAARLERVAEAASRHLATMSEDRYQLQHSDEAGGRGLRGLELKVHDDHSDVERPTSSLSGGETFMASLSMALGLAEVVQAESGGIGMESLFIDEGFGSLDEDTLEHVMAALHRLQGEGRRVGLVSHVTEMHRAIPTQLRIHRRRAGSTTEMVIP